MAEPSPNICIRCCQMFKRCTGFCTRCADPLDEHEVYANEKVNLLDSANTSEKHPFKVFDESEEADDAYDMSHRSRGRTVIFNHYFSDDDELHRKGTHVDELSLRKCLHHLGFDYSSVEVCQDFSRQEILDKIFALSEEDYSDCDCLIVAVMTHGFDDTTMLCASDLAYKPEELWQPFDACPSLKGKPKLFFIQACRGELLDSGRWVQMRAPKQKTSGGQGDGVEAAIGAQWNTSRASGGAKGSSRSDSFKVPVDMLVAYSSPPGYRSFRNPENGSFFIQNLCRVLLAEAENKDLVSVLTKVNRKVSLHCQSISNWSKTHGKKQAPCFVTGLTKRLVFTPSMHLHSHLPRKTSSVPHTRRMLSRRASL